MTRSLTRYLQFIWDNLIIFGKFSVQALYSVKFHQNIYQNFRGWGIRYLMVINLIASLAVIIPSIKFIEDLRDYFLYDKSIELSAKLNDIISQMPLGMQYDGRNITFMEDLPHNIYDDQQQIFAVINTDKIYKIFNEIYNNNIKVIFTQNSLYINYQNQPITDINQLMRINYQQILSDKPLNLDKITFKQIMASLLQNMLNIAIVIVMPIYLLLNCLIIILKKIINILIMYIFLNMRMNNATMRDAFRVVVFSSSLPIIVGYLSISCPNLKNIAIFLELWSMIFVIYALETNNKNMQAHN